MITKITLLREFHPFADGESFDLKPITVLVGDQGAGKSTLIDLIIKYEKPKLMEVNTRYNLDGTSNKKRGSFFNNSDVMTSERNLVDLSFTGDLKLYFIDTEKHNPRTTYGETTKEYKDAIIEVLRDESLHKVIQTMEGFKSVSNDPKYKEELDKYTNRILENVGTYFDSKRGGSILGDEIGMDMATVAAATMQSHGQSIFPLIAKGTENAKGGVVIIDEPETALSVRSQNKVANILFELSKQNQVIVATHSPIIMSLCDEVLSLEHRKWMKREEFIETQKI